jgi:hypothetical protein
MDALERDDLEVARGTSPGERGRQLLDVFRAGVRLKRAALRVRHPAAGEAEIDALLAAWLEGDDRT